MKLVLQRIIKDQLSALSKFILDLPRTIKWTFVITLDFFLCFVAVWLSYYLRLGEFSSFFSQSSGIGWAYTISVAFAIPTFIYFGFYRAIFRYSGQHALIVLAQATSVYGLLYFSVFSLVGVEGVPGTIGIIQPILLLFLVGASRVFARIFLGSVYLGVRNQLTTMKVLIYGAGYAGRELASVLVHNREIVVVGFLDDDVRLHDRVLNGLPVFNPEKLGDLVPSLAIKQILLALPDINRKTRNHILSKIQVMGISVRTLPTLADMANGKVTLSTLRDLEIDDLLGRDPVAPNYALMEKTLRNKVVMVTGAGGSIGSELCRQIFMSRPSHLLLIENSEYSLYKIQQELEDSLLECKPTLVPLLASIQDGKHLLRIISLWQPHIIFHAAAYKHVPLVELNVAAAIKNNVFGTLRLVQAAVNSGANNFVLISSDKSVRPTSMMGATKRLAEMILQAISVENSNTRFTMVRFGNVLGSSGSVVPKFRQQILDGDVIKLTHLEMTRYFMTTSEAVQLVIQAADMAKGGDLFVLDMGEPVKIMDLAKKVIELSGLKIKNDENPNGDVAIEISGLRPGEKLYEELLIGENPEPTEHHKIMKANEDFLAWGTLQDRLYDLEKAVDENDIHEIRRLMMDLVEGFKPESKIVDLMHIQKT
jgi:FlaA1/EpsC-like NDP-sugar epimerase